MMLIDSDLGLKHHVFIAVSYIHYQIKSNQKHIYIAPYVASESEAHGGDD